MPDKIVMCAVPHPSRCSKSNAPTSQAELPLRSDFAARLLQRHREVALERNCRQRKLDQIRIGLNARLPLGLLDQRAYPATDPAALLAEKTRSLRSLHDRLEPRLADENLARLRITPLAPACRRLAC